MSLWWAKREQLDNHQVDLIENTPLTENHLVLGPAGSGKTNVLLRRAQFVRTQGLPNVLVLTFTRPLTEFVKTGCFDDQGREIFPQACVTTIAKWLTWMFDQHGTDLPEAGLDLVRWKKALAIGAIDFARQGRTPHYDTIFVDEAQDLLDEEIELIAQWSPVLFLAGDDRQRIFAEMDGLTAVRRIVPRLMESTLPFHYRLAPEICKMADRILTPTSGKPLSKNSHYSGPRPGTIDLSHGPMTKERQLEAAALKLKDQIRVYSGLIQQGDRLGVIVARKEDRDAVFEYFQRVPELTGKSKIIRSREEQDGDYSPSFDADAPICIVTVQGCKGLEFRAVHWLFSEELGKYHDNEHYYTVVTRAKTSLDVYYTRELPQTLARAHAPDGGDIWG
jgi:hypothetical protein